VRRVGLILLTALLCLSLAGNALLGWIAWTTQKEYRALARQYVKTKQDLAAAQAKGGAPSSTSPATSTPAVAAPATAAAQPAPAGTGANATAGAASEAQIRAKFEPRLLAVQTECEGQLEALLTGAKAEYNQAKSAGGTVDVAALGAKYLARADGLRRQCDRQVDAITGDMATELRRNGLPLALVDEVRAAYESRIVERQAEIMAKAPAD
jgi:hypothetical protein